jgi:hypothetical protein
MRTLKFYAVAILAFLAFAGAVAAAESSPADKLVGTWEGDVGTKTNARRRLIVDSVKRDGDQWVGVGRFGNADKDLNTKVDIKITVNGNDVALEFLNSENNRVEMKLAGDNELSGDIRVFVGKKMTNADIKLKKIN